MSASAEVSEADRRIAIEAAGREHALQLVEALQSAFKTLDRRAQTRQKWTLWDQQAFEKVEAALVTVGAELPI